MKNSSIPPSVADKCRVTMIIAAALIMGVLTFAAITFLIVDSEKVGMHYGMLTIAMAAFGFGPYVASFVVPKIIESSGAKAVEDCKSMTDKAERSAAVCQTSTIVQYALIEAASLPTWSRISSSGVCCR